MATQLHCPASHTQKHHSMRNQKLFTCSKELQDRLSGKYLLKKKLSEGEIEGVLSKGRRGLMDH